MLKPPAVVALLQPLLFRSRKSLPLPIGKAKGESTWVGENEGKMNLIDFNRDLFDDQPKTKLNVLNAEPIEWAPRVLTCSNNSFTASNLVKNSCAVGSDNGKGSYGEKLDIFKADSIQSEDSVKLTNVLTSKLKNLGFVVVKQSTRVLAKIVIRTIFQGGG